MLILFFSCSFLNPKPEAAAVLEPIPYIVREKSEDGLACQLVDLNGNRKANLRNCYRGEGGPLVIQELDLNNDEKMDITTFFNAQSEREREEHDLDYDGVPEWVDHFEGDVRKLTEIDSNIDRKVDIRLFYQEGKVFRKEKDSNFDGSFELLMTLNAEGQFDVQELDEKPVMQEEATEE